MLIVIYTHTHTHVTHTHTWLHSHDFHSFPIRATPQCVCVWLHYFHHYSCHHQHHHHHRHHNHHIIIDWTFSVCSCLWPIPCLLTGYETARSLALHGATIIMACRNLKAARERRAAIVKEMPKAKVEIMLLDLASLHSVREFAETYKNTGWYA